MSNSDVIGLFPLRLVVLPGEIVPLHIFEERYKKLIADCRATSEAFGIVLHTKDSVTECGCTAEVVDVIEEFEDGRLNILVEGKQRFRLKEVVAPADESTDYLRGVVEYFEDEGEEASDEEREAATALFRRMLEVMEVESPREPAGSEPLSFRMAAAVDFGLPLKQQLLESQSEVQRLEFLVAVMNALIPSLELRKQRQVAIGGNGKGY